MEGAFYFMLPFTITKKSVDFPLLIMVGCFSLLPGLQPWSSDLLVLMEQEIPLLIVELRADQLLLLVFPQTIVTSSYKVLGLVLAWCLQSP